MLAVTMPQRSLVWPFHWPPLMADKTSPLAMDTHLTSGSSVDNENTTLSQLLDAFQEDEETSMAPLNGICNTEKLISVPFLNGSMEMNNDILDLSKPLQIESMQHGISSMSLDSLNNDTFVDALEVQSEMDNSCLSGMSELKSYPDGDVETEKDEDEVKGNDQQMLKIMDSPNQDGRNIDNESETKRQLPLETVGSDSTKVSALSRSPESYTTLYKAFEIAQEESVGTDQCDKRRESTLDMLNRTSPKLQRVAVRKAKINPENPPLAIDNPVVSDQKLVVKTLQKESPLQDSSLNLTWVKANDGQTVTTFADILQKKGTPSPKSENAMNVANSGIHWTVYMQEKSDSETDCIVRRIRKTKRISRPKSLPIQLRHIRRPVSRPLKTPENKQSKAYIDFLQSQSNMNVPGENEKSQKDIHTRRNSRGYYEPMYMTNGYHTLPAVLNWYKNRQDIYTDQSCGSFKRQSPITHQMRDLKSDVFHRNGKAHQKRDAIKSIAVEDAGSERGFDDWQDLEGPEVPPQDITVSPRDKKQSSKLYELDMVVMKGLVTAVGSAVDLILDHFSRASKARLQEKAVLGDTVRTPTIGFLVLNHLCPAIANIIKDGMKPYIRNYIIGKIKNSIWQVVEATTELGPGTRSLYELVCLIQEQTSLSTDALKFNAFIFGLLSTKCLEVWLNHIRRHPDIVRSYFDQNAFLSQCNTKTSQLFNDLLVAVQPLSLFPFKLALDFELKYTQKETYLTRAESLMNEPQSLMSLPWLGRSSTGSLPQRSTGPRSLPQKDEGQGASWQSWASPSSLFGSLKSRKGQSTGVGVESKKVATQHQKSDSSWMRSKELLKTAIIGRDNASMKERNRKSHLNSANSSTHGWREHKTEVVQTRDKTFQIQRRTAKHNSISNIEGNQKTKGVRSQTGSSKSWSLGWMTEAVSKKLYGEESHKEDTKYPVIGAEKSNSTRLQKSSQSEGLSERDNYPSVSVMDNIGSNVIKAFDYMLLPKAPKEIQMVEMKRTRPLRDEKLRMQTTPPVDESRRQAAPSSDEARIHTAPPSVPKTQQNLVKTRCHNVSMEQGFLSFSKGEILQINQRIDRELLLCSKGVEKGLVYEAHIEIIKQDHLLSKN